jgi:hypothetical protein
MRKVQRIAINASSLETLLSTFDEGVFLSNIEQGATLHVVTESRTYALVALGNREVLISGHPEHCPAPVRVRVQGSTWGGSLLRMDFIGKGMHLEYWHPVHQCITTSQIIDVRVLPAPRQTAWAA